MISKSTKSWLHVLVPATVLVFAGVSCGDDVAPPPPNRAKKPAKSANKRGARKRGGKKSEKLQFYPKVETYTSDDEEAANIRHRFTPSDFEAGASGDVRRDPFRSFVIRGLGPQSSDQSDSEPTRVCSNKKVEAPNYSLRDLRLVGIVLRGTRSYALFRDSASYGHIVRKGDCLGQEKARVAAIRAGFVSLEVLPDTSVGEDPQERSIQLYPEEMNLDEGIP